MMPLLNPDVVVMFSWPKAMIESLITELSEIEHNSTFLLFNQMDCHGNATSPIQHASITTAVSCKTMSLGFWRENILIKNKIKDVYSKAWKTVLANYQGNLPNLTKSWRIHIWNRLGRGDNIDSQNMLATETGRAKLRRYSVISLFSFSLSASTY